MLNARYLSLMLTGCLLVIGLTGCGGDNGPPSATVSGKVTLDGEPLESGGISFIPTDGKGASAGATILDGSYSATVPLGSKRVEIRAPKVVGKRKAYNTPDSPEIDIIEELIPFKYNAQSELRTTVETSKTPGDFDLKSEPKK